MLEAGSTIRVQLPDREGLVLATVLSCTPAGRNCKLLADGVEVTVNISKCAFTVVTAAAGEDVQLPAADGAADESGDSGTSEEESDSDAELEEEEEEEEEALDAFRDLGVSVAALDGLTAAVAEDPAALLRPSAEVARLARTAAKALFTYSAKLASAAADASAAAGAAQASGPPPAELYVDGFDAEQIWLQLDMAAGPALKRARRQLRKAGDVQKLMPSDVEDALDEMLAGGSDGMDSASEGPSSEDEEEDSDEEGSEEEQEAAPRHAGNVQALDYDAMLAARGAAGGGRSEEEDGGQEAEPSEGSEEEEKEEQRGWQGRKRRLTNSEARAAVEDDFMKLDEMEAFLLQAERDAARGSDEEEEQEEEEEDLDLGGAGAGSDSDLDDAALDPEGSGQEEGDDSEGDLEALLDNAAALAGARRQQAKKGVRFDALDGSDSEDEEDSDGEGSKDLADDPLANATYEDFFGARRGGQQAQQRSTKGTPARKKRGVLSAASSEEEEDDEEDLEDEDGFDEEDGAGAAALQHRNGGGAAALWGNPVAGSEEEEEEDDLPAGPSTHERRLSRTADRIRDLEAQAMADKEWFYQGEVGASGRPKNSALEVDLDFDTTVRPPPAPTEETTRSLEELVKARIVEGRFDDVIRVAPAAPERKRTTIELDDKRNAIGLGELYERDYVQAVTGVAEDKEEEVRALARAQYAALAAKLDQLSHMQFRPAPSIEEVTVKVDVPAIMMEEAAPAFVSAASMRVPEEVYRAGSAAAAGAADGEEAAAGKAGVVVAQAGAFKSEAELTQADRRRRRATKKRVSKKRKADKDAERAARAVTQGGGAPLAGRRSAAMQEELRKMEKAAKKSGGASKHSDFTKSKTVFGRIQAHRDGGAAAAAAAAEKDAAAGPRATHWKL